MSESKKVVSCTLKQDIRKDKGGNKIYDYNVKFENDDKTYQFSTTKNTDLYFKEGETVQCEIQEIKWEKDGNTGTFWKVTAPKQPFSAGGGGKSYPKKTKAEVFSDQVPFHVSYIKDLVISGHIKFDQWLTETNKLLDLVEARLDKYWKTE